ncbi:hypothetical protein [Mesobaculum littorinae]|uniref:hypothetical protein n=1 Tax=Mesobaculum littorinae TaxID=2486419 RepID=UPI0019D45900|nr:hypothetical protein [Mesobaculum littorinae]
MPTLTATAQARPATAARPAAGADAVARDFESVFLTQAVEEMMKSVDLGEFAGGQAAETWRSFLARAVADEIAGQGRTGIAQSVQSKIAAYGPAGTERVGTQRGGTGPALAGGNG